LRRRVASETDLEELARFFSTLGNPNRLELLRQLRRPRRVSELRASPEVTRPGENPERAVSRQAVRQHLEKLLAVDVAQLHRRGSAYEGNEYLANHRQLFVIAEQLRDLARFHPEEASLPTETRSSLPSHRPPPGRGPALVLVHGIDEGRTWTLGVGKPLLVGRLREADVCLDYDPFVSNRHADVTVVDGRTIFRDLGSRNGTLLNFARMRPREPVSLAAGDIVSIGRSTLVYRH